MHHFALSPQGLRSPDLRESLLPCLHQESLSYAQNKEADPTLPVLPPIPLPLPQDPLVTTSSLDPSLVPWGPFKLSSDAPLPVSTHISPKGSL